MSKTLAQLETGVRNLIREATAKHHTQPRVWQAINTIFVDFHDELVRIPHAGLGRSITTATNIVANTASYPIPTGMVHVNAVQVYDGDAYNNVDIITAERWAEGDEATLPGVDTTALPNCCVLLDSTIVLRPTPTDSVTDGLRFIGAVEAGDMDDAADTTGLPHLCDAVIEKGAAALLLLAEGSPLAAPWRAEYGEDRKSVVRRLHNRHTVPRRMPLQAGVWD